VCSVNVYVGEEENVGQYGCILVCVTILMRRARRYAARVDRLRYLNPGCVFLTLKGLCRQLQDDLLGSVWRDIEPIV
jgi:hypothetical protein